MDRVAFVDNQLTTFKDSLKLYREVTESNFAEWLDKGPQFFDKPALLGMNRTVKLGSASATVSTKDSDFSSTVAVCPKDGKLLIESKFVSLHDIPVGNIKVDVTPVQGGNPVPVDLDEQGKGVFKGIPGKKYYVRVQSNVTKDQITELFDSYDGLTQQLQTWLEAEWRNYKPLWPTQALSTTFLAQLNGTAKGSLEAIKGAFDGIKRIFEILKDPEKFAGELGQSATDLIKLAKETPAAMEKIMLLASDQAALFLLLKTAVIWLLELPPSVVAGKFSEQASNILVTILIDIVLAVVLTFAAEGSGIAYLGVRLATYGAKILNAVTGFIKAVFKILKAFMESIEKYKKVAARAAVGAFEKGKVKIGWDRQNHAKVREHEHIDDHSKQSTNPDEKSAACAKKTCTNGCPVSMVTGEELLTLTDGELGGLLPFSWTRLYRTSAAEIDCGLGYGWSHALAQRVDIQEDEVLWTDHENRVTTFPLPSVQRPAITNSLSEAAIFIGDDPSELVLTQAGERKQFYHFRYNSKGATLIAISDDYGNRLQITRDIHGRIKRVDNGAGRALLVRYDRKHIVAIDYQQFRPADNLEDAWSTVQTLVTYGYDAQHRLIEARNAAGEAERYAYNDQNVILERQLAGGASFYWEWEKEGKSARCIHHWASFSQMDAHYAWDDKGSVTVTNADGSEEIYTHDDQARLVAKVDPNGAEHLKAYDDKGRLIAESDPLGAVTEYQYNEAGRLVAVIPPEDAPTQYEYSNGFVSEVLRGESLWKYQRNDQGDITEQIDPDGNSTHYSYNRQGRLLEIRHPDGSRHQLGWNNLGQLLEEHLPDGGQRKYRYDALGRQITRQDESGAITHYQWDAANRLAQITLPGGATRAFTYNAYGKVTAERDELGRVTRYEYADNLHLVSRRINPDGSQLRYRYENSRLLLSEIENERGEHYQLDYYPNGLIQQETGFDGRRTAYEYDLNGQLLKKTEFGDDGSELVTEYQRDAAGRLLVKTLADGEEIHYSYDALGRLVNVDDGHWPLAYEYDPQDRLITEHQGWGTTRYEYDKLGQLSHCRLPDGSKLDYRHQSGGRLGSIDLNGSRLTTHQFSAGREQQRQQGLLLSQYQYDEQGRLQAHTVGQQDRNLFQRRYAYDANGNLAGIDDSRKGNRSYHYDPLDRLINVRGTTPESFAHDPAGNLLGQGDQPTANLANVKGNRLLMQGDRHYDYDAYGNLARERRGTGQKLVTGYHYDCQHRLIGVSLPGGSNATYKYDAFGRRIAKIVDGHTTEFLWQGERLIAESANNRYRSYIYEPGTFRPLAMLDGEGPLKAEPFYYQLDHLGTPQELTDYSGQIMWSAKYRAYGNLATLDIAEIDNPLRFQGQYFDGETGLHYNRNRYYNPGTGRYLTPDPIKLAGGLNNYQYVPNPTGWVDPLGLSGECPDTEKCRIPVEDPSSPTGASVDSGESRAPDASGRKYRVGQSTANPKDINFTQPGVNKNGQGYEQEMRNGTWDWQRSGPIRVMEVDGQLVSYDNRRLRAAQMADLEKIPIEIVAAEDIMPGSKKTWEKAFKMRRNEQRNWVDGQPAPATGIKTLPKINE
ncbi:RHS repeat-associated core domain-containing protein [Pseudomonas lini]|uniref:RHS repeat protein n=1 Tax=Pseudomonas lini TaxID=163011 RepID=A0A0J6HHQ0_9PSED|nr:RHS repeat-associated core domain-containing protein [Pseudomonas lini]KAB0503562.1 RHS repeat protein [Pseudomonas lini]KMM93235.1 type IV secretion protein Rhs [Pseudomonas lini]SDT50830.1 RHS repeat-associated core domain-containing protein [Pseudomonas lini]